MRKALMILVVVAASLVAHAGVPGTDLGQVSHGGAAYLPPAHNGFLDILYMTDEYSAGLLQNGIATAPAYGWVSVDDCVLEYEGAIIGAITCWIINHEEPSGFYMRFWNDTGGSGPGAELDNASATYELISTGEYSWGYLLYECDIDFDPDYEIDAEHFWWGVYFSSGFWYMLVRTNAYDDQCYFDQGGGGSGPWHSSYYMWGTAYDFFQIVEHGWLPDLDPPYVCDMDPDDGETEVPLDSDIVFHCVDDWSYVDTDTIEFTAVDTTLGNGRAVGLGSPNRTLAGDFEIDDSDRWDVICTFTPDDDFYEGDTITCTVAAGLADSKGNEMVDDFVWSFTTEVVENVSHTTWGAVKAGF